MVRLQVEGGGEDNAEEDGKCGALAGRCLGLGDEWKMQLERTEGLVHCPLTSSLDHSSCLLWLRFRSATRGVKSRVVSRVVWRDKVV